VKQRKGRVYILKRIPAWKLLIGIFAIFWVIFAVFLFLADIPYVVVSFALTTVAALSCLVVALAWAVHNNL
jgi:hypothetical protein